MFSNISCDLLNYEYKSFSLETFHAYFFQRLCTTLPCCTQYLQNMTNRLLGKTKKKGGDGDLSVVVDFSFILSSLYQRAE